MTGERNSPSVAFDRKEELAQAPKALAIRMEELTEDRIRSRLQREPSIDYSIIT